MEDKDYEKVKQECWTNWVYRDRDRIVGEPSSGSLVFAAYTDAFDCAYRLGMEAAKKEMLTANVDSSGSNVESLERKQEEPKYHVGQKCKSIYANELVVIAEIIPPSDKENTRYRVKEYPYLWNECELEPYTEPQEDKHFDNILKRGFKSHNRMHIASMAMQGVLSNNGESDPAEIAKYALACADALIKEAEKGDKQ